MARRPKEEGDNHFLNALQRKNAEEFAQAKGELFSMGVKVPDTQYSSLAVAAARGSVLGAAGDSIMNDETNHNKRAADHEANDGDRDRALVHVDDANIMDGQNSSFDSREMDASVGDDN